MSEDPQVILLGIFQGNRNRWLSEDFLLREFNRKATEPMTQVALRGRLTTMAAVDGLIRVNDRGLRKEWRWP
jgi:hypothetical protein